MTVYHAVMGLKSVPLLEESYRWVGHSFCNISCDYDDNDNNVQKKSYNDSNYTMSSLSHC